MLLADVFDLVLEANQPVLLINFQFNLLLLDFLLKRCHQLAQLLCGRGFSLELFDFELIFFDLKFISNLFLVDICLICLIFINNISILIFGFIIFLFQSVNDLFKLCDLRIELLLVLLGVSLGALEECE
jgi:hypothetical protein